MSLSQQKKSRLGLVLYILGVAIGLLFALYMVWADFEAYSFDVGLPADQKMDRFSCPLAITSNEFAFITAKVSNNSEREVKTIVRLTYTVGSVLLVNQLEERVVFAPGQTYQLSWPIQAADAAWGRFIMARIYMLGSSPLPSMAGYCGVVLINLPFLTGQQVLIIALALALAFVIIGGWLWFTNTEEHISDIEKNSRLMVAVVVFVALTGILSVYTEWLVAGPLLVINLLLALAVLVYRLNRVIFSS